MFRVKPGSESEVRSILAGYRRPATIIDDGTRLVATSVFMHGPIVVRVMDIEGSLPRAAAHLARQPGIQDAERALNPYLEIPRALSDSEAARRFFAQAAMIRLTHRAVSAAGVAPSQISRHALLYPLLPGTGAQVDGIFAAAGDPPAQAGQTRLLSTTVFRHGDTVVRVFELAGELGEAIDHLAGAAALQAAGRGLAHHLQASTDLTTEEGLRDFFRGQLMTCVTDRRALEVAR
jgi:hypothetical protein